MSFETFTSIMAAVLKTIYIYKLSIYRSYIWITMIKLLSNVHSWMTPHTSPSGWDMGCVSWVLQRKMTAMYRKLTVFCYIGLGFCETPVCSLWCRNETPELFSSSIYQQGLKPVTENITYVTSFLERFRNPYLLSIYSVPFWTRWK